MVVKHINPSHSFNMACLYYCLSHTCNTHITRTHTTPTYPTPTHACAHHPSSQLRYDGYETAASSLSGIISSFPPTAPSSRLSHLVQLGLKTEGEGTSISLPCPYWHGNETSLLDISLYISVTFILSPKIASDSFIICGSLSAAATNPEMADMLPHMRRQGVMDLEFESDGKSNIGCYFWVPPSCSLPLSPSFSWSLSPSIFFLPSSITSLPFTSSSSLTSASPSPSLYSYPHISFLSSSITSLASPPPSLSLCPQNQSTPPQPTGTKSRM